MLGGVLRVCFSFFQPEGHPLTHSLAHSLTLSLSHSPTHSVTHSLAHSLTLSHTLAHSLSHSLTLAGAAQGGGEAELPLSGPAIRRDVNLSSSSLLGLFLKGINPERHNPGVWRC